MNLSVKKFACTIFMSTIGISSLSFGQQTQRFFYPDQWQNDCLDAQVSFENRGQASVPPYPERSYYLVGNRYYLEVRVCQCAYQAEDCDAYEDSHRAEDIARSAGYDPGGRDPVISGPQRSNQSGQQPGTGGPATCDPTQRGSQCPSGAPNHGNYQSYRRNSPSYQTYRTRSAPAGSQVNPN